MWRDQDLFCLRLSLVCEGTKTVSPYDCHLYLLYMMYQWQRYYQPTLTLFIEVRDPSAEPVVLLGATVPTSDIKLDHKSSAFFFSCSFFFCSDSFEISSCNFLLSVSSSCWSSSFSPSNLMPPFLFLQDIPKPKWQSEDSLRRSIWWYFCDNFFQFSIKKYVVGGSLEVPHQGASNEYPQTGHNIHVCFYGAIKKLSQNYHQMLLNKSYVAIMHSKYTSHDFLLLFFDKLCPDGTFKDIVVLIFYTNLDYIIC